MDGTLLDHHTYDYSPALSALAKLPYWKMSLLKTES